MPCSPRKRARSTWPASPAASTTSSSAAIRTSSATPMRRAEPDLVGRDAELGADQEGREGCHFDRRRHHARAPVAAVRAQADAKGGVGRARSRGTGRRALRRLDGVLAELRTDAGRDLETQLGDLLAAAIVLARSGGVDAESALRGWAVRFRRRFEAMERLAEARQLELPALTPQAVAALWIESGGEP